jgi:hypothetical protein
MMSNNDPWYGCGWGKIVHKNICCTCHQQLLLPAYDVVVVVMLEPANEESKFARWAVGLLLLLIIGKLLHHPPP